MKSLICDGSVHALETHIHSKERERQRRTYHAVELGPLVTLGFTVGVLGLAGAELAEVLCGAGSFVREEFHFHAAEGFTWCLLA